MLRLAAAITSVLVDLLRFGALFFRSSATVRAENLVLRRQLGGYLERGIKPKRVDFTTRVSLALFTRFFDWRDTVVNVRPATIIRWHRMGWRILWHWKSRAGRPPIPLELKKLIRRMAMENPLWGQERIADELLLKLGIRVSPRTVGKYMPKRAPGEPRGDQRWSTFLRNHAKVILACDFFVAVTATFRMLYVFVVIEHGTRRLKHLNVTPNPTADCTLQQLREVVGDGDGHRYLIHDRDRIFAKHLARLRLRPTRRCTMSAHSRRLSLLSELHLATVNITASLAKRIPAPTHVGSGHPRHLPSFAASL